MRRTRVALVALLVVMCPLTAAAQQPKPYKEGPVVELSYIKVKPGRFDDYMKHLNGPYKALMEANKKAGLITSYAIYSTTARSPQEPDLILAVTYANMAALDRIDEAEALAAKVIGPTDEQNKGMMDRSAMRDVLGSQLIRELILK
jgi:hypothetical protein